MELLRRDEGLLYACTSSACIVIIKPPPLPLLFCCMLSNVSLGVKQCVRGRNFTNEYLFVASRFLVFCKGYEYGLEIAINKYSTSQKCRSEENGNIIIFDRDDVKIMCYLKHACECLKFFKCDCVKTSNNG